MDVLSHFGQCQIAHFACHGQPVFSDPSQSRLLLEDWESNLLMVSNIISLKLKTPKLAYLSACYAADNPTGTLFDEGIHLIGACQLAGFIHSIGTLWRINDEHSVTVSRDVYATMSQPSGVIDVQRASEGVHKAIRRLREVTREIPGFSKLCPDDPLVWAPYVHIGPECKEGGALSETIRKNLSGRLWEG